MPRWSACEPALNGGAWIYCYGTYMLDVPAAPTVVPQPFRLLGTGIEVAPLLAELDAHPELWDEHGLRKSGRGTPHAGMNDIWVRYNDVRPFQERGDFEGFNDPHIPVWYPAWYLLPTLRPFVMTMASLFQAEMIGGVLITRIPPGASIEKHTDRGWHVEYFDKLYLSLRAPEGCWFCTERARISPRPGDLWLIDNRVEHWVENHSEEERITLIVCLRTAVFGRTS